MSNKEIRVRMAPSPTGFLHIGSARTTLYNYLFAKHNGGKFILRIEDTDKERSKKEYEDDILAGLKWLGLDWDEFYRQSDRVAIHSKYVKQLLDNGKAFYCYHTKEELEAEQKGQQERKEAPRHICEYKKNKLEKKEGGIIRLAVDENSDKKILIKDIIRGDVEFEARLMGDFSIARAIDDPLYHMAVVVDDYEMNISHIIRAEEHLSNTPRQILIQQALEIDSPEYAHIPLILAPDRSKLSKRHGATGLTEYKNQGYLPDAIFSYLALLGFTPPDDKEVLTKEELISVFDLNKVHKSGAIFDIKKLDWMNGEYMKKLSNEEFSLLISEQIKISFGNVDNDYLLQVAPLMRERMKRLSDVGEFAYLFKETEYGPELLFWKKRTKEEIIQSLKNVENILSNIEWTDKEIRMKLDEIGERLKDRGLVYWPLRSALTGVKMSPDPVEIAIVLGKDLVLKRISNALTKLNNE